MFHNDTYPLFVGCRLGAIRDLVSGRQLMTVLLKLFTYCVKVRSNRQELIKPEMNTIAIMLGALNLVGGSSNLILRFTFVNDTIIKHYV